MDRPEYRARRLPARWFDLCSTWQQWTYDIYHFRARAGAAHRIPVSVLFPYRIMISRGTRTAIMRHVVSTMQGAQIAE